MGKDDPVSSLESPFQEQFTQDPYLLYAELRQREPVYRTITSDGLRVWVVTRFEDARSAFANQGLSKNLILARNLFERNTLPGFACRNVNGAVTQHMLESDPPNHTRLRKLVENSFTAGRINALRPRIEQLSSGLLSSLAGELEIDLVNQYAFPLAFTVICEILGLPQGDRDQFRLWINDYSSTGSPEQVNTASDAIANYLTDLLEAKWRQPSQDVLGRLLETWDGDDFLTDHELISMVFLLLSAGYETMVNLIANGMLALLRNPDQMDILRADSRLLPAAVEEFLRFDSPVNMATLRFTTRRVTIGAVEIPADEFVLVALASANRDHDRFAEADRLNLTRSRTRHISFGHGIHYCLGAALARQEAEVAFRDLLAQYPRIDLAVPDGQLRYRHSLLMRGLEALPLRVA